MAIIINLDVMMAKRKVGLTGKGSASLHARGNLHGIAVPAGGDFRVRGG